MMEQQMGMMQQMQQEIARTKKADSEIMVNCNSAFQMSYLSVLHRLYWLDVGDMTSYLSNVRLFK